MKSAGASTDAGRDACVRDLARARQAYADAPHGDWLRVGEDQLPPQLGLMRLGRLSIVDDKRRLGPAQQISTTAASASALSRT